jgi:hypothetical protein
VAAVALVATALAGCGDDDEAADEGDDATPTSTTVASGGMAEGGDDEEVEAQAFVSRPDLTPPVIDVVAHEDGTAPGYLFLAPKQAGAQRGPLIVDDEGEIVWSGPTEATVADFRVQQYRGEPVLTWYEGSSLGGYGEGEFVIADTSYEEVARVAAGNGRAGDLHEFQLTDDGTALLLTYDTEPADLSAVDGPADGFMQDNHVQEVDVASGEVLLEWSAADHVEMTDTYSEMVPDAAATEDEIDDDGSERAPFDWFHVNSVAEGPDGTLLVSARNTHAVYAVDRATGEVRWTLGGRSSDFPMTDETRFAWQHDARLLPDGTISLFDNEAAPPVGDASRALVLDVDEAAGEATLVRELTHPDGVLAGSQGNTQVLDGGNTVVGWGSEGRVSEFTADGEMVFDATWAPADSYRVFRQEWAGAPATPPDLVVTAPAGGEAEAAMSWNGATDVASWRVLGGPAADDLDEVTTVERDGFETVAGVGDAAFVQVEALDADGAVLQASAVVEVTTE